jgi:ribonucleotide monophosphatase NagD (HAD superfamily)
MSSLAHFSQVKAFLFDVDGVFTNNEVQITEAGELLRTIHL